MNDDYPKRRANAFTWNEADTCRKLLTSNAPGVTHHWRPDLLKQQPIAFFKFVVPEAREILDAVLENYASDSEQQFTLPNAVKARPISDRGNANEIIGKFGGTDQLSTAFNQLQSLLYAT